MFTIFQEMLFQWLFKSTTQSVVTVHCLVSKRYSLALCWYLLCVPYLRSLCHLLSLLLRFSVVVYMYFTWVQYARDQFSIFVLCFKSVPGYLCSLYRIMLSCSDPLTKIDVVSVHCFVSKCHSLNLCIICLFCLGS